MAVAASLCLSACGASRPAQSAVQARLTTLSGFAGLNDASMRCIAGVLERYASASSLRRFVRTGNPDDIEGKVADESTVTVQRQACVTAHRK